jgi:radical SAM superfamily enzyme YgiQ (UPF0313 family)
MDILLAHGYYLFQDPHEQQVMKPYPPLGILSLSAYLKREGFSVGVFDSTFSTPEAFDAILTTERPSVVGLYVNLMTKRNILTMIAQAKASGAFVILGGPEPAYYAKEYLAHGADIVVSGEGELTLAELIPHLSRYGLTQLEGIAGIQYCGDDGQVIQTPARAFIKHLSDLPWPDREAIDLDRYLQTWKTHHGYSSVSVIHARGCAYSCTWCSHSVYGVSHRRRTPQDAADELLWIRDRYAPDMIWYADDVFAVNHRWLFEYAAELDKRGVKIPFESISRADRLTPEVIATLAAMGCKRLWNGSESGSQPVLDAMNRRVQVEDVQHKTHLLQAAGIETGMFIMLGYAGETVADIVATVDHLKRSNPDIFLTTVAYPIKGTPYYAEVESAILADKGWQDRSDRDLTVAGRYSRRFYHYATRWMVNEVALHRANTKAPTSWRRKLKMRANIAIGRVGMWLTQHEIEQQGQPVHPTTHASV